MAKRNYSNTTAQAVNDLVDAAGIGNTVQGLLIVLHDEICDTIHAGDTDKAERLKEFRNRLDALSSALLQTG